MLVFGYGSLLNRATLPPGARLEEATITGWVRQWRNRCATATGPVCGLTLAPRARSVVEGAVMHFAPEHHNALMAREADYAQMSECEAQLAAGESVIVTVFSSRPELNDWACDALPICLSYVDVVLQGFLQVYGAAGVEHVLDTTEGWHLPLINDRSLPRYPRPVALAPLELDLIDESLRVRRLID